MPPVCDSAAATSAWRGVNPASMRRPAPTASITTSAGGGYYVSGFDGGKVVISSVDGSTIGTITGGAVLQATWSADDRWLAARADDLVSVYRVG